MLASIPIEIRDSSVVIVLFSLVEVEMRRNSDEYDIGERVRELRHGRVVSAEWI